MSAFARAAVVAILRQHGLSKLETAAQQNSRRRPGISNRIAAALDGEAGAEVADRAKPRRRFGFGILATGRIERVVGAAAGAVERTSLASACNPERRFTAGR